MRFWRSATFNPAPWRLAAQRIALALYAGVLLIIGYMVAPQLFHDLDRETAGKVAGHLFHAANLAGLLLACTLAAFWMRKNAGVTRWGLLLLSALVLAINEFLIRVHLLAIKAEMHSGHQALQQAFALWHGMSAGLHLAASLSVLILVAMGPPKE